MNEYRLYNTQKKGTPIYLYIYKGNAFFFMA